MYPNSPTVFSPAPAPVLRVARSTVLTSSWAAARSIPPVTGPHQARCRLFPSRTAVGWSHAPTRRPARPYRRLFRGRDRCDGRRWGESGWEPEPDLRGGDTQGDRPAPTLGLLVGPRRGNPPGPARHW